MYSVMDTAHKGVRKG